MQKDSQQTIDNFKYQIEQLERQLRESHSRIESLTRDDKRHCDEIRRQLVDMDELRTQMRLAQENCKAAEANFKHAQKETINMRDLLEKEKRINCKYVQEIDGLRKRNEEVAALNERQNRYCEDMRKRYEDKKSELQKQQEANKEMVVKYSQATSELGQLKDKVMQSEMRVRSLVEELRSVEEKNRALQSKCETLKFTSEQFEKQKKVREREKHFFGVNISNSLKMNKLLLKSNFLGKVFQSV